MERTTVRLPPDLLDRARKKARDEGRTLTSLIEQGLREVVAQRPAQQREKREVKLPRCSSARGGLAPDLDPIKFVNQLQEEDDLAMIERMKRR